MTHSRLAAIRAETRPLQQNRLLFRSLADDARRYSLYRELEADGFPALRFKSVMRRGGTARGWPSEDVYLLTARADIATALRTGSVKPYAALDSGGKFMLGIDDPCPHARQRDSALDALRFRDAEIEQCVRTAIERTMVLPQKLFEFDLVKDVARQAALRLMALVFGLPAKSHLLMERAMDATYRRLTFQIIGRHFVADDGLTPSDASPARELKEKLEAHVREAAARLHPPEWWDKDILAENASVRVARAHGEGSEATRILILGLIAGTVGNVTSAVANTLDFFFRAEAGLIDLAAQAARSDENFTLNDMIDVALTCRPPAPFLARAANPGLSVSGLGAVPAGSHLLLAMGADPVDSLDALFGGALDDPAFAHNCVGRHLALPLVRATVREVLKLPGLARVIDPASGQPKRLVKRWGAICESYPMRYQRDRRLNQQPLFVVLPIKPPVAENARKLRELTRAGAPVIERALADAKNVHFAWFGLIEGGTHLAMFTVFDGDFEAYVEHFALKVPLFDEQFKLLQDGPPTPIRLHPKEFVDVIRKYNRKPLEGFFYSAYPLLGVAEIVDEIGERP